MTEYKYWEHTGKQWTETANRQISEKRPWTAFQKHFLNAADLCIHKLKISFVATKCLQVQSFLLKMMKF